MSRTGHISGQTKTISSNSTWKQVEQDWKLTLDSDELTNCMRCGFCLPACPTYRETGLEAASPRGRIALMKSVSDGWMTPDASFDEQMNLCLGCRACEPACPAGVRFGHLLEQARSGLARHAPQSRWERLLRRIFFRGLFPHPNRLRLMGALLALYQRSGLKWFAHKTGLAQRLMPESLHQMDAVLPQATSKGVHQRLGTVIPPQGKCKGRVGLFRGCIMDVMFADTNQHTAQLLSAAGYEVIIPEQQVCCGALQAHGGETETSRSLARQNIRVFQKEKVDWIVSNAGGCGAQLVEYAHLLKDDPTFQHDARWFTDRVKDISQLIAMGNPLPLGEIPKRVTFQDSCHLRNGMGCSEEPRTLLHSIPGIQFVDLFESERCCGSAGIYNVTQPEMSMSILDEKMEHVEETQADILVTSNPGCLLQMKLGIRRAGLEDRMEALHLVDLLNRSVEAGKSTNP
ncbi:(Fe-S)-binding protein [Kroppenstedtia pulmonis]|uniref:Glycolate oxidase iron-sulfur subunit n=1 Tax=Kroppenstedtia pulmonis TaxID=1380685 RepID=A0A7D4CUX1_9BACL|nr:(Fe-S)-binding protein [Kroppenstedtia pulmonis]QKG83757.1 (Fe-S)-binding protein [Kroppenstedtia pulmonis]